jgi:hypothetical protein
MLRITVVESEPLIAKPRSDSRQYEYPYIIKKDQEENKGIMKINPRSFTV